MAEHPFPKPPRPAEATEVAPGILWLRFPMPFQLDHVNVYLIDDGEGWAIVDTGILDEPCVAAWDAILDGPIGRRGITRVIATHFHSDHVGLAGRLCERTGAPLWMSHGEYMMLLYMQLSPPERGQRLWRDLYSRNGMPAAIIDTLIGGGHRYMRMVAPAPSHFRRLVAGRALRLGGRDFAISTGAGHSPDQVMLANASDKVFLAADQVLARISPNVSVVAPEPQGDPLGQYLESLERIRATVPADHLVLPGHGLPFLGLHERIDELAAHHEMRCGLIMDACANAALNAAELVPHVFRRELDPHQMGFAFTEVLAHVNLLVHRGALLREDDGEKVRFRAA